ncbi:MAG: Ig-like domain-containing protein, partial [Hyphomicrobium sp.]
MSLISRRVRSGHQNEEKQLQGLRRLFKAGVSYRALEPRIAFDAAAVAAAVTAADQHAVQSQANDGHEAATKASGSSNPGAGEAVPEPAHVTHDAGDAGNAELAAALSGPADKAAATVVFIDKHVENLEQIISAIDLNDEIVLIDDTSSGLDQMATYLATRSDIGAIHIISHGTEATLKLGSEELTNANLAARSEVLAKVGASLSETGDILIYGCDVAQGSDGESFVNLFSNLTGADVAASTDITGASDLGGNWVLEKSIGIVEAKTVADYEWHGTLNLSVTATTNTATLQSSFVPTNSGITITALTLPNGTNGSYVGTFSQNDSNVGLKDGVVLATGNIATLPNAPSNQWDGTGSGDNTTYAPLQTISTGTQRDVARIQLAFTPDAGVNKIAVYYVFGSEEYPEYVGSSYNDAFGFFISGTNPSGGSYSNTNFALIPGTSTPVSINNVNAGTNSGYFVSNAGLASPAEVLDGQTVPLSAVVKLATGQSYTVNLAITDIGDANWNSAVFIEYFGSSLRLDLDANNSTATGPDYHATYTEQSTPISIVDSDASIQNFDSTTDIHQATITLTNKQAGDVLSVGTLPTGITATVANTATSTTVTLTGVASEANYEAALKAIKFSNSSDTPSTTQRQIQIVVNDGDTNSGVATSRINIDRVPDLVSDNFTTNEDTSFSDNVLANETDLGDTPITSVAVTSGPSHGTLTAFNTATGAFTYVPSSNYSGTDSFTYKVTDADGSSATATATVTVNPINDAPVNHIAPYSATEDGALKLSGLSVTDVDAGSGNITVTLSVSSGSLTATSSGGVTVSGSNTASLQLSGTLSNINAYLASASAPNYVQVGDFNGTVNLTMTTNDGGNTGAGGALSHTDLTTITITPVVDIAADAITTNEDTTANFNVLTGTGGATADSFEGTPSVTSVSSPTHGSVTFLANGAITYTPDANYFGSDSFTYTVTSGGKIETATVSITVNSVNDAPVPQATSASGNEDTTIAITLNGTDVDGSVASFKIATVPLNGTLYSDATLTTSIGIGSLVNALSNSATVYFKPSANWNGATSFNYSAIDNVGLTSVADATASISVAPVNDAPTSMVVANQSAADGDAISLNLSGNFSDVDGDTLTYGATGLPAGLSINTSTGIISGTIDHLASATSPYIVTVTAVDASSVTTQQTFTWTVTNPAPVASTIPNATGADGSAVNLAVGGSFSDPDGDTLTFSVSGLPAGLTVNSSTGAITGTLHSDASQGGPMSDGIYTISVTATDSQGASFTKDFTYTATNPPPVAGNDTITGTEDAPLSGSVTANDSDPDGDTVSYSLVTGTAHGTLTFQTNGTFSYTPDANFHGADSFTYQITDSDGGVGVATTTLNITAVNDAPVASGDSYTTSEDTTLLVAAPGVLVNDSDVDGDSLS